MPRPGEQKAWTFQLNPSVDFERLPLKMYLFNQSENESIRILEMFDNGKKLFPYDVASNLANRILKSSVIPESLAAEVFLMHGCDNKKLKDALNHYNEKFNQHFNLRIEDSEPIRLSEHEIKQAQEYLDLKKDRFLSNVGVRGIKITDTDALIKLLKTNDQRKVGFYNRATAAKCLGEQGLKAKKALPDLKDLLNDCNVLRKELIAAIEKIENDNNNN